MVDFRILGSLEVERDGTLLPLGSPKDRAVLAILLLHAGRVVSTDALVSAFWGDEPPPTAGKSLQNSISQLRKLLGPDVLATRPPGYVLPIEPVQLDLGRFERLVEEARGAEPAIRSEKLRQALALWRGPPLAEFTYETFAQLEIARLEELRLATLEQRVDADLELGKHSELVGEVEALVSEHPLRERLRGQLMLALYRSGRQAEALHVYQSCRRALLEALGIDPSPVLQQLHGAILRQESGLEMVLATPTAEDHTAEVVEALLAGRLVPVLGSDVTALARQLAQRFAYPDSSGAELTRVSQYIDVMKGSGPLYDELHAIFSEQAAPTPVHRLFARIPPLLRERGVPHQLLVTTSYDHALEQALLEAGEEFDVVSYLASGRYRGKFCHLGPAGDARLIEIPNTYTELSLETRTVILKLHGQVDRSPNREWESFVVTEDDYLDYLAQESELANLIPVSLAAKLRRSHFLFLGYTMADWNLRVILNRLWGESAVSYRSWAVQPEAKPLERQFWRRRDVEVVEQPLDAYAETLAQYAGLEETVS